MKWTWANHWLVMALIYEEIAIGLILDVGRDEAVARYRQQSDAFLSKAIHAEISEK